MKLSRVAGFLVAFLLTGCATGWGWFGRSEPALKPSPLTPIQESVRLEVVWRAPVGRSPQLALAPSVAGSAVYAAFADGTLTRFSADRGQTVWRVDTGKKLTGGVEAGANLVLAGTLDGEVLAYGEDGKLRWTAPIGTAILSPPRLSEGIVVVRGADGRVFALEADSGKRRWVYQRTLPALSVRSFAGVAVERGAVFAGFPGGKLVALRLTDGVVGWEATVAQPRGATELERIADVASTPEVAAAEVCAAAFQGRTACFDVRNGNLLWARDISSYAGLDVDGRGLYVTTERSEVMGLELGRGATLWRQEKLTGRRLTRPTSLGSYVAVGDFEGYVHLLNADDGGFAARVATDGNPIATPPLRVEGGLLVQTTGGTLMLLRIQ
jgi:outer membrane protein assembly factor BamB